MATVNDRVLKAYRHPLKNRNCIDIREIAMDLLQQDFTYGPAETKFELLVEYLKRLDV